MIRFSCPTCSQVSQIEDEHAGRKVACPKCGQRVQVPELPKPPPVINRTVLGKLEPEGRTQPASARRPEPDPIPLPVPPESAQRPRRRRPEEPAAQSSGNAIASFVCGLMAFLLSCVPFLAWPLGLAAFITGAIYFLTPAKGVRPGAAFAILGIIFGILGFGVATGMFLFALASQRQTS